MKQAGRYSCLAIALVVAALGWGVVLAQDPAGRTVSDPRFMSVDIFIDPGAKALAAYQLEFSATTGGVQIVGIEGGAHPAFQEPPYFDPVAIQRERVILAAFNTAEVSQLPSGRTRVATIHLRVAAGLTPAFVVRLEAAADAGGKRISCETTSESRTGK